MELSQIRAFLVLSEELHFGRAAQRLNISQPPLSRQIRQLEEEIGVDLFERTSRSVRITPAGDAFRREAKDIIVRKDAAVAAALNASSRRTGLVRIGFVGASTYSFLPRLAEAVSQQLPWLGVEFQEATSVVQIETLALGRIDVGIMRPVEGVEALQSSVVLQEPFAVALPVGHPLARKREFEFAHLDDQPLIGFSAESPYIRNRLLEIFRHADVRPRVIQEFAQSQAILSLVSAGLGLAVVPSSAANASFGNIVFRKIRLRRLDDKLLRADLVAVWKPETRNDARAFLLDLVKAMPLG